ncbi:MAG: hypothetical protein J7K48_07690 [Thermococcus sp.]|nr:hypothetical protein [Thermococcus sp.]
MQANVNLDALLEKMKAELERVKNPVDVEKILKCAEAIKPLIKERETRGLLPKTLEIQKLQWPYRGHKRGMVA